MAGNMIPEIDLAIWRPAQPRTRQPAARKRFTVKTWVAPAEDVQKMHELKRRESIIVHLNTVAKTAQVTVNGVSRTYRLKAVDPHEYRKQMVNTHGYKATMMGDVILLTKKG